MTDRRTSIYAQGIFCQYDLPSMFPCLPLYPVLRSFPLRMLKEIVDRRMQSSEVAVLHPDQ